MAIGGGVFLTQNKIMPGAYLNFVSAARASANLAERGVAAFPIETDWGVDGTVFSVTSDAFQSDSLKLFGYAYTAEQLKGLRDLFLNVKECLFYRLNSGGTAAKNTMCTAKYNGTRGNTLNLVVEENEDSTEGKPLFDVMTYFDGVAVDEQVGVASMADLKDNDFVIWNREATLSATAGLICSGGTNGTTADANYQTFLDKLEAYSFNVLGTVCTNETVKGLFAAYTKRMRDEVGAKFQCVLFRYTKPDYEGVISVENGLVSDDTDPAAVYWTVGAAASCAINRSLTNATYTGEYDLNTDYTQKQLEQALHAGKFMFHRVGDGVRVLRDINTFVSVTVDKNEDFQSNQIIRVLDQIANDIASMFADRYLGKVQNDNAGRASFWGDIVAHHRELQALRAIENFDPDEVKVVQGSSKDAVMVTDPVRPVTAMAKLYMTVIVM